MNLIHIRHLVGATLLAAGVLMAAPGQAAGDALQPAELRGQVAVWIEQERQLAGAEREARERTDTLARLREVLVAERDALAESLELSRQAVSEADAERQRLMDKRESLRETATLVADALPELEARAQALVPRLPAPLQRTVDPLHRRIGRADASLSERLQNVIGILSQVDRFARGITREVELVEVQGRKVEVTTVYVGLAFGIYAAAAGDHVGFMRPGPEGWRTEAAPAQAAAIRRAIEIYTDPQRAELVPLPVSMDQGQGS